MSAQLEIILIASLVAVTCAILGVFLVLRRMSLMSDAISHSVLLGIVLGFIVTKSLSSPLLIIGATLVGILTVYLTEVLVGTRKVKEDAAIGLVFPFLFSIAVILVNRFLSQVHLDTHMVLLGELAFAPFNRITFGGITIPESLFVMGIIFILNVVFILLFYKELKIATFDSELADSLGFKSRLMHYLLMMLVSITAVGAFDVVGSILVVAFVIALPAAAYLLTHKLSTMLILSSILGVVSSIFGYIVANRLDVSIAGSMATVCGIIFSLSFLFSKDHGLISKILLSKKRKVKFGVDMLIVHLLDHENSQEEKIENKKETVHKHLNWTEKFTKQIVDNAVRLQFISESNELLCLTELGRENAKKAMIFG